MRHKISRRRRPRASWPSDLSTIRVAKARASAFCRPRPRAATAAARRRRRGSCRYRWCRCRSGSCRSRRSAACLRGARRNRDRADRPCRDLSSPARSVVGSRRSSSRSVGCRAVGGLSVGVDPAAVVVLLPRAVLASIDVAVSAGIDIAAARRRRRRRPWSPRRVTARALVGPDRARGRSGPVVRVAIGLGPVVAALHRRGTPASVHVRALTRRRVGAGARVVGLRDAARAVRAVCRRAARVGAGARVVASAHAGAAVRTVNARAASVGAGPRVVPGGVSVGGEVPVVVRDRSRRSRSTADSTNPSPTPRSPTPPSSPCSPPPPHTPPSRRHRRLRPSRRSRDAPAS